MKNKGFTLVEMLAVIALLAIIGTITAVSVKNIKKNQDEENKLNIISAILTGTRNYITENSVSIVSENASPNESNRVYLDDLLSKGYVDFDIKKYPEYYYNNKNSITKTSTNKTDDIRWTYAKVCSGGLKYEIIYDYFDIDNYRKKYSLSDCGCAEQSSKNNSFKLCEAETAGKAGWDTNGVYYKQDGNPDETRNLNFDTAKNR